MSYIPVKVRQEIPPGWSLHESERGFGCLESPQGLLPLRSLNLEGRIRGLNYSLKLEQVYRNIHKVPLEATYIFPLPARAAVSRFVMTTESRRIEGEIKERGQARQEYQQAIQAGKQAAMVEQERAEIFTMTVGNIPAGEQVTIEIELDGPLYGLDDSALLRFPLVVAPRYIPGQALDDENVGSGTALDSDRVPDASRISPPVLLPGFPNPVRLGMQFDIEGPLFQLEDLESTLPLQAHSTAEGYRLQYVPQAGRVDHDFMLRLPFHPNQIVSSLHVEPSSENAAFCLTVVPPAQIARERQPKQVVFLLDRSGSMEGWKMSAAKRATSRLIDTLNERDQFRVLVFDDRVEQIGPAEAERKNSWFRHDAKNGMPFATDRRRFDTIVALRDVHSRGGTEIRSAMLAAVEELKDSPNGHIVFLTDGQVGNEAEILKDAAKKASHLCIHSVGIDQAVNAHFLERLAASGRQGLCQLVQSNDQLDSCMVDMCRRIGQPVLSNIQLQGAAVRDLIFQNKDLYAGVVTRIYGRFVGAVPAEVVLQADETDWSPRLQPQLVQGTVERLWAREQILEMEHNFAIGQGKNSADSITAFSLRYRVLSQFTAFLAVDHQSQVGSGPLHQVTQAVATPAGWGTASLTEAGGGGAAFGAPVMRRRAAPAAPLGGSASPPRDESALGSRPMEMLRSVLAPRDLPASPYPASPPPPPSPVPGAAPLSKAKKAFTPKREETSPPTGWWNQAVDRKGSLSGTGHPVQEILLRLLELSQPAVLEVHQIQTLLQKLIDLLIDRGLQKEESLLKMAMDCRSQLNTARDSRQPFTEFLEWAKSNFEPDQAKPSLVQRVKSFFKTP